MSRETCFPLKLAFHKRDLLNQRKCHTHITEPACKRIKIFSGSTTHPNCSLKHSYGHKTKNHPCCLKLHSTSSSRAVLSSEKWSQPLSSCTSLLKWSGQHSGSASMIRQGVHTLCKTLTRLPLYLSIHILTGPQSRQRNGICHKPPAVPHILLVKQHLVCCLLYYQTPGALLWSRTKYRPNSLSLSSAPDFVDADCWQLFPIVLIIKKNKSQGAW